jgi:hypothetical protein
MSWLLLPTEVCSALAVLFAMAMETSVPRVPSSSGAEVGDLKARFCTRTLVIARGYARFC